MAIYFYSGINNQGNRFHRFDEADDIDDIYELAELNDEELSQLVRLPSFLGGLVLSRSRKLKDKEVVELCQQLSMYLDGGVDLAQIFQDLLAEPFSRPLQKTIKKISTRLNEGESLSSSFRHTKAIPEIVVTLVEIGEKSGNISQALKDAADYLEREIELRAATIRALIYPVFTLTIMIGAFVFWIAFVLPQVVKVIKIMNVELPIQTQILISISDFIHENWIYEILAVASLALFFFIGRRVKALKYYLDKLWWHFPITGKVVLSSQMAFYFNYFKVLYDAGIPVLEILIRMQKSVPSRYFKQAVAISNKSIKEGNALQVGYEKAKLFEMIAIRIIGVGEQTGNLQKQLDLLGRIYMKRVQVFVETLPKVLEPLFIVIIGLFFVLFGSTLLGPLYEVAVKIGGAS